MHEKRKKIKKNKAMHCPLILIENGSVSSAKLNVLFDERIERAVVSLNNLTPTCSESFKSMHSRVRT